MSLTTESLHDLTGQYAMNRMEKNFAKRGMKEKKRGMATEAVHTRKGTDQKKAIYDNAVVQGAAPVDEVRVRKPRRKARRAAKENTPGSTRLGNVKLSSLQRHQNLKKHLDRRAWDQVEESGHSEILEGAVKEDKPVSWKGKNKLVGRNSKY